MSKFLEMSKAEGSGGDEIDAAEIHLRAQVPKLPELKDMERFYRAEAKRLADVLFATLPGGTVHALLVELLERKVSLLRVRE